MEPPLARTVPVVALDRGVINAVADSDGNIIKSPRFYGKALNKLKRAQQAVARKVKKAKELNPKQKKGVASKNLRKAYGKVAKLHRKVRRQREYFVHKVG